VVSFAKKPVPADGTSTWLIKSSALKEVVADLILGTRLLKKSMFEVGEDEE